MSIVFNPPREKTETWEVGVVITDGRTRWIIRIITGRKVELETANMVRRVWRVTTLRKLGKKASRQ